MHSSYWCVKKQWICLIEAFSNNIPRASAMTPDTPPPRASICNGGIKAFYHTSLGSRLGFGLDDQFIQIYIFYHWLHELMYIECTLFGMTYTSVSTDIISKHHHQIPLERQLRQWLLCTHEEDRTSRASWMVNDFASSLVPTGTRMMAFRLHKPLIACWLEFMH